jgi:DNA-binding XRE family transcriptional regulator
MVNKLEDIEDIKAVEAAQTDNSERFPLDLIEKIASGENAIKAFREYRRLSQVELAKEVDVSRQYISQIENGERVGTAKLLKKIAHVLEVDLYDIA